MIRERARGRFLSAGLLSLAALCGAAAQAPPLTNMKDLPKALLPMVETELAFAADARARGMKEVFIEFAADDGLLFRRTAVNARELWRQTNPAPKGLLSWHPTYADVARAGDLGYAYGTYEAGGRAGGGHYVRIWKRRSGRWRVVLDITNPVPPPPESN